MIVQGFSGGPHITPSCLWEHILVHWLSFLIWLLIRYNAHFSTISAGTSGKVGAFHIRVAGLFALHSNMGVINPFHSSHYVFTWSCLPLPSSVSGSIPLPVHYPPASMVYRCHPSALHMCSFHGLQPNHFTCGLQPSSVDAPVDVHGPSHNFPFFHPREASLVGHWVTAFPSFSCSTLLSSPPVEVVLHGVGLVHLSHV